MGMLKHSELKNWRGFAQQLFFKNSGLAAMATPQAGKLTHTQPPMHFSLRTISNTVCAYVAGIKMVHQMAAGTR